MAGEMFGEMAREMAGEMRLPRRWQDLTTMQKTALWQAPLIGILSLEIGFFMWALWLGAWGLSFVRRWWLQLPILMSLIAITAQLVPLRSADFFILMLVILLPFTWRLDDKDTLSPAGLCPTIFLAGSVFIFQSQFIVLLGLVAWLLAFLLWFATALTGFRLSGLSIRWLPIITGSIITAAVIITIFTIIPRISTGFIPSFATASQQIGLTDELSPGGMSDLLASDDVAFRAVPQMKGAQEAKSLVDSGVQTQLEDPYWRVFALTSLRGNQWRRADDRQIQNNFVVRPDDKIMSYQIVTDTHDLSTIPIAGFPASSARSVSLGYGYNRYGEALLAQGRDSRQIIIEAIDATTHRYDYPASTSLSDDNPRLQAYGRQMRATFPDERAFIAALMSDYGTDFLYDTKVTIPQQDALDAFFFDVKTGYCSYYATSLATLLRAGGLEAHVVTGYLGGEWNNFGNYWLVKQSDAHAWVEVRLSDGTWLRLDPTLEAMQFATPRGEGNTEFGDAGLESGNLVPRQQDNFIARFEMALAFVDSLNLRITLGIMNYGTDTSQQGDERNGEDAFALLLAAVGLAVTILFVVYALLKLASQNTQARPASEKALERLITAHTSQRLVGESLVEHASKLDRLDKAAHRLAAQIALAIYQQRFAGEERQKLAAFKDDIKQLAKMIKEAKKASSK